MDVIRSNLWNKQNENKLFELQQNYINHLQNLRRTQMIIDSKKPYQPDHIKKTKFQEKIPFKKTQSQIQFLNENLMGKINGQIKNNLKYNKEVLENRLFNKESLNFEQRMGKVQQIMMENTQMAKMIKSCKPSVNNKLIQISTTRNENYKQNIIKNSKRIINSHLQFSQMPSRTQSMTNFQFSQFKRKTIPKFPQTMSSHTQNQQIEDKSKNYFITSDKFYSPKMEEQSKGNISNPDIKQTLNQCEDQQIEEQIDIQ